MFDGLDPKGKKKLGDAMKLMKAGKIVSNALGTSPTDTPDVDIPSSNYGTTDNEGEKDGGGGSEQQYQQSDQPNGGSMGKQTGRQARSGSYLKRNNYLS